MKNKVMIQPEEVVKSVKKLNRNERQAVLAMALSFQKSPYETIQNISCTTGSLLMHKALNCNPTIQGNAKIFREYAHEILRQRFPYWSSERIDEEVDFFRSKTSMHTTRMQWEFKVINKHFNK
ncbi:hypothetical protein [Faecalimicrobium dakarense]|uniref:hypothetical protein n=1 Tax=Faecalimicrobium dakarense TaxID=1301100 RepID=UPI0004AE6C4A|nr:hypothetical protein [[Clostridium] dakarense]